MASWSHLPGWPRVLEAELAAEYLGLALSTFHREVKAKRLPAPVQVTTGRHGWDRLVLDAWVDRRSGREAPSAEPPETNPWLADDARAPALRPAIP